VLNLKLRQEMVGACFESSGIIALDALKINFSKPHTFFGES
jgi:hypothetical protein